MTAFTASRVAPVPERDYAEIALAMVERARVRLWVAMFICDIRPNRDVEGLVLELVSAVISRHRLGVDVRVLVTGAVRTTDIAVANTASALYLSNAGVPVRRVFATDEGRSGTHGKFVICDDQALVGSQNWTDDGFRLNTEDAVLVDGSASEVLASEFLRLWAPGRGVPARAPR